MADTTTVALPTGATEGAAAAANGNGATNTGAAAAPAQGDRPAWLPEKFKAPEELAKAYSELEKAHTAATTKAEQDKQAREQGRVQKALTDKGINLDELATEFAEKGKLSAKTYAKLAEAGLSDTVIDQYVAGQKALADKLIDAAYEFAGGEKNYAAMTEWAKANWDQEALDYYNKIVSTGTEAQIRLAVRGLLADWIDATGDEPDLVQGAGGAGNTGGYASQDEYLADIRNPRYQNGDPAFHKLVDEKLKRSRY